MESTEPTNMHRGFWRRVGSALVLPKNVTAFEVSYLQRMNRIALLFFYAHLPIFLLLAWLNDTGVAFTLGLTAAVLVVPTVAYRSFASERNKSLVFGFTSMCMGGVLVHIGQGPVQIEMHFYFFAVLAMLALFANPMAIVVAATTVALHHLVLWFLIPDSVFNYDAPLWVVLVHAAFVVLETVAACFIARNFFDNVIGLEKKVEERTVEIRRRNRDMRLVLDNVRQGLVTIDREARLAAEHSSILQRWFGSYTPGETLAAYLGRSDARFGQWFQLGWESVIDDFLPLELALSQLPSRITRDGKHLRLEYQAIQDANGRLEQVMVVVSDITSEIAQAEAEARQREILAVFERILNDRQGFTEFHEEARRLLGESDPVHASDLAAAKRALHTLKGNSSLFGIDSVARICHAIEECLAEDDLERAGQEYQRLRESWDGLADTIDRMLGQHAKDTVMLSGSDYEKLLRMVVEGAKHPEIARCLVDLTLEPTEIRLGRFAEQARQLAQRLEKGAIEVEVAGNGVRLARDRYAPFWSSFTHVLRNAIDHGIEAPEQRRESGKDEKGRLQLRSYEHAGEIVLEVRDDGRGIDWQAVRERASRQGLPHGSQDDLIQALLHPGFSTRDEVSDTSGRGVGLAAVHDACRELGGRIDLRSEPGRGSVFQFRFPATAAVQAAVTAPN
jgi:two-component system, chemotaxis family, sensor kinase CheA